MKFTKKEIAESFSTGKFEKTYPYLSDDAEWNAIGIFRATGKNEVIEQCDKTAKYYASVTTDFKQTDVIESPDKIAVTGTAEFSENGKRIESVSACDVYEFDEKDIVIKITSYCVVKRD